MKKLILIIICTLFSKISLVHAQELTRESLKAEIINTQKKISTEIANYKGESRYGSNSGRFASTYNFFNNGNCEYRIGDYHTYLRCYFEKGGNAVSDFLYRNAEKVAKEIAKENGYKSLRYSDDRFRNFTYNTGDRGTTFLNNENYEKIRVATDGKLGHIDIFSITVDQSVPTYFGSVTNLCYQSSNASNSEYAYFQVIDIYSYGDPKMSEQQLIEFAKNNTVEQINRRSWRWRGKITGTQALKNEIDLHKQNGKSTIYATVYIK